MTKAEEFTQELEALIQKHGATRREYDEYDRQEEFIRTVYELKFPDYSTIDTDEWQEVLEGIDPFRP